MVLLGAASSDLPPVPVPLHTESASDTDHAGRARDRDSYARIQCPVLILALRGDPAHPVETAETVHQQLVSSSGPRPCPCRMHVSEDENSAREEFPVAIKSFLDAIIFNTSANTASNQTI